MRRGKEETEMEATLSAKVVREGLSTFFRNLAMMT